MPFDPTFPQANTLAASAAMRAQFQSLFDLIQAIPPGPAGPEGPQGIPGVPGPAFSTAVVDAVNTVPYGQPAAVTASFDGSVVHLTFYIPEGPPGPTGSPGEVTQTVLDTAIAGTSANTNSVSTLDTPFADPDTESLRQAFNTLVLTARR